MIIAETDEKAWELAERHLLINYRDEYGGGKWKHPLIGAEDTARVDQIDAISQDRFLVGSPDTVIRQLQKFKDAFGVDHLICRLYFPGIPHEFIMNELKLLAREVMPSFRKDEIMKISIVTDEISADLETAIELGTGVGHP